MKNVGDDRRRLFHDGEQVLSQFDLTVSERWNISFYIVSLFWIEWICHLTYISINNLQPFPLSFLLAFSGVFYFPSQFHFSYFDLLLVFTYTKGRIFSFEFRILICFCFIQGLSAITTEKQPFRCWLWRFDEICRWSSNPKTSFFTWPSIWKFPKFLSQIVVENHGV